MYWRRIRAMYCSVAPCTHYVLCCRRIRLAKWLKSRNRSDSSSVGRGHLNVLHSVYCIIKIGSRSLTFYNLIYNEALLTPSTHQKNFMQNIGGRKKYLASTYPKKKNSWGIKGLKKISCLYQITQPPPPQKLNGWPLSSCVLRSPLAAYFDFFLVFPSLWGDFQKPNHHFLVDSNRPSRPGGFLLWYIGKSIKFQPHLTKTD